LQLPSSKSITVHDVTNVEDQKRIKTKSIKSKKTIIQLSSSSSDKELDKIILQSDGISDLNSDSDSEENPTGWMHFPIRKHN
jgi:serine/threonine protein phosphatase PrpC